MAKNHNIRITLTDEEEKFLKWLTKHDKEEWKQEKWTVQDEMQNIFRVAFEEWQERYSGEYMSEKGNRE